MIDLSIWLIAYNQVRYIRKSLDSILMQKTKYSYEIVITDDNSTDGTAEIIQEYSQRYPDKIRAYISDKNYGSPRGNVIKNNIKFLGNFWCMLEADDYWTSEHKIETQLNFLYKHSDYVGSCHSFYILDERKCKVIMEKPSYPENSWDIYACIKNSIRPAHSMYCHTSTWMWRNLFLNKQEEWIRLLKDKNTLGDVRLSWRMLSYGGKVRFFDEAMSCYRITGKGVWTSKSKIAQAYFNKFIIISLFKTISVRQKIYFLKLLILRFLSFYDFKRIIRWCFSYEKN